MQTRKLYLGFKSLISNTLQESHVLSYSILDLLDVAFSDMVDYVSGN